MMLICEILWLLKTVNYYHIKMTETIGAFMCVFIITVEPTFHKFICNDICKILAAVMFPRCFKFHNCSWKMIKGIRNYGKY